MSSTTLARPQRRLRVPAIDTRVVTGIVLVALAVLGGLRLAPDAVPTTRVFVAASDLDAGHVLTRADLTVTELRAPASVMRALERPAAGAPVGRILRTPVRSGAVLPLDALGAVPPAGRDLTIPVTPEHALGGAVRAGDRVDVLATFDKGTDAARTITVASGAVVRGVTWSDGLFGQQEGMVSALTVTVPPSAAVVLAFATRNGELDIVRARGDAAGRARARFDAEALR